MGKGLCPDHQPSSSPSVKNEAQTVPDHVSILSPPLATAPEPAQSMVTCGDFWPAIALADFRSSQRVDDAVTTQRALAAIRSAMATALIDLRDFAAVQIERGYTHLADVPADQIDNTSLLVHRWRTAIMTLAKAELAETMRDYDATGSGERSLEYLNETIVQLRRDAAHAIRDIKGRPRTCVELI
jgi:Phage head completion protein (GPL)